MAPSLSIRHLLRSPTKTVRPKVSSGQQADATNKQCLHSSLPTMGDPPFQVVKASVASEQEASAAKADLRRTQSRRKLKKKKKTEKSKQEQQQQQLKENHAKRKEKSPSQSSPQHSSSMSTSVRQAAATMGDRQWSRSSPSKRGVSRRNKPNSARTTRAGQHGQRKESSESGRDRKPSSRSERRLSIGSNASNGLSVATMPTHASITEMHSEPPDLKEDKTDTIQQKEEQQKQQAKLQHDQQPTSPRRQKSSKNWLPKSPRRLSAGFFSSTAMTGDDVAPPDISGSAKKTASHHRESARGAPLQQSQPSSPQKGPGSEGDPPPYAATAQEVNARRHRQLNRGGEFNGRQRLQQQQQGSLARPKTPYGGAGLYLNTFADEYDEILCEFNDSARSLEVKDEKTSAVTMSAMGESSFSNMSLVFDANDGDDVSLCGSIDSFHTSLTEDLIMDYEQILEDFNSTRSLSVKDDDDDEDLMPSPSPSLLKLDKNEGNISLPYCSSPPVKAKQGSIASSNTLAVPMSAPTLRKPRALLNRGGQVNGHITGQNAYFGHRQASTKKILSEYDQILNDFNDSARRERSSDTTDSTKATTGFPSPTTKSLLETKNDSYASPSGPSLSMRQQGQPQQRRSSTSGGYSSKSAKALSAMQRQSQQRRFSTSGTNGTNSLIREYDDILKEFDDSAIWTLGSLDTGMLSAPTSRKAPNALSSLLQDDHSDDDLNHNETVGNEERTALELFVPPLETY